MFHKNLMLDFIFPTIAEFQYEYGKGSKADNYNEKYRSKFQKLKEKYNDGLIERKK